MTTFLRDVRHALRSFARSPGFSGVAIATLVLGIGASTALYSAVNALLLRPLPLAEADRIVFGVALREGFDPFGTSPLEFAAYKEGAPSLALAGLASRRSFHLAERGEPERVSGAAVMADYLSASGVSPLFGRRFTREEDRPGGPAVAILGHALWQRRFGGSRNVLGQSISLDGRATVIVGVFPPGFDMPYTAELWVPLQMNAAALPLSDRAAHAYELIGLLKPGVPRERADREVRAIARRLERDYPQIRRGWTYTLVGVREQLLGDLAGRTRRSLLMIAAAVGLLLLICCANVANLLLARGVSRDGEMAIRLSLGAGRWRLLRQLLTESLCLASLGGAGGLFLAYWTLPLLALFHPIRAISLGALLTDFRIDGRALAASVGVTLLTGVLFGTVPALASIRSRDLSTRLARRPRAGGGGADRRSLALLAVAEIALSMALLVTGGLMLRSYRLLQKTDLGFRPEGLLTLQLPLSARKYPEHRERLAFLEQVRARVRRLPGVDAAGFTTNLPLDPLSIDSVYEVEGRPATNPADVPITAHRMVSPGYLEALGVTLVRGRLLDERDRGDAVPVVVVGEELVRKAWPGGDPIGKRIRRVAPGRAFPWLTVVGVVRDPKEDRFNFRVPRAAWYLPYAQHPAPLAVDIPFNVAARAAGNPAHLAAAIRAAVHEVDPTQPVSAMMTLDERLSDLLVTERFSAALLGTLAVMGLALAALGLYGILAFSVRQRIGEIGLRMALGARPRDVTRIFLARGALLLTAGAGIGLVGARALAQLLSASLYGVRASDPATFLAVAGLLVAVALAACYLPARRAAAVDPMTALRTE